MIDTELHRVADKPAPATDDELLALCDKASPAPWSACHEGHCNCKQVWTADHPVAKVEAGEWGDTYPAVRVSDSSEGLHGTKMIMEAFMDGMPYGEIKEETAQANAQLIAEARAAIPRLIAEKRALQLRPEATERLRHLVGVFIDQAEGIRWHINPPLGKGAGSIDFAYKDMAAAFLACAL